MAVVTKTLKSSGGDYTLLSTWESTEQTNLVSAGDSHVLECYNDWPTGLVGAIDVNGWTTSAANNITIKAAAGQGHGGSLTAGMFFINTTWNGVAFKFSQAHTVVKDLRFKATNVIAGSDFIEPGLHCLMDSCISETTNANNAAFRMGDYAYANAPTARNCIAVCTNVSKSLKSGFGSYMASPTYQNCTSINFTNGYTTNTHATYKLNSKNCVSFGATTGFANTDATSDYNASDDASAPGANSITTLVEADFTDYAGGDYSVATGSALIDAGVDLSGTFTDDITGTTRGATWEIGAFDYIAVGGARPQGPFGHPFKGAFGGPI